jgi:hypothetical protein
MLDHLRCILNDSNLTDRDLVHDVSSSPCQLYFHYVKCVVSNSLAHHWHVFSPSQKFVFPGNDKTGWYVTV